MNSPPTKGAPLSERQKDVVRLIAQGLINKEIAERLETSEHTVKYYIAQAMRKLGARTRAHMVAIYLSGER